MPMKTPTTGVPLRRWAVLFSGILLCGSLLAGSSALPVASTVDCYRELTQPGTTPSATCLRAVYAASPDHWPAPHVDPGVKWQELAPLPAQPPTPADNPSTPAKVALGRRLFDEPRLSLSGQIACASCHDRDLGWADGRRVSFGHDRQSGRRNAPSVAMSAYAQPLFWDGRAATLEEQALFPIHDPKEMAFSPEAATERLQADPEYREQFAKVFGDARIDPQRLGQALAAFQRSLVPRNNRFDRFLRGNPRMLDDEQLLGLHLFRTQARCMNCHSGPALTDNDFHNLGLHFHGRPKQDLGRYEITGDPADAGKFRTPSLRGVTRTGPWMHDGGFTTLQAVLSLYNIGGARPRARQATPDSPVPQPDPLLQRLDLERDQLKAIEAFLETL